jgi:hypothetical protein
MNEGKEEIDIQIGNRDANYSVTSLYIQSNLQSPGLVFTTGSLG